MTRNAEMEEYNVISLICKLKPPFGRWRLLGLVFLMYTDVGLIRAILPYPFIVIHGVPVNTQLPLIVATT
jgi:hypothetical protein